VGVEAAGRSVSGTQSKSPTALLITSSTYWVVARTEGGSRGHSPAGLVGG
jgi:hypothetical protein